MALEKQSRKNFEVIISEDDYNEHTINFIQEISGRFNFPIVHIYQQKDDGFRKNEMLNKSIKQAKTEKMVFIDGDCIPHKHFVKNYIRSLEEGYICEGREVLLGEEVSAAMKEKQSIRSMQFFRLLFSDSKKLKDGIYFPFFPLSHKTKGRGLVGKNWGVHKQALIEVNGFDMDYVHAGVGEDVDIEWRLQANGNKTRTMKNKAIVYHLFHHRGYSEEMVQFNMNLFHQKQKQNNIRCLNGLDPLK